MANQSPSQSATSRPAPGQKKSNFWLVILIIIVAVAILWPLLRRKPPAETGTPGVTTTLSVDGILDEETGLAPGDGVGQAAAVGLRPEVSAPAGAAAEALTLRVYFGNRRIDPENKQCVVVYPSFRTVPRTAAVGRAALTELLKGPTTAEAAVGAITAINPGAKLQNLTIANGVARADFNQALGRGPDGGGEECLVQAARAQITETLKQFPTVRSVVISVNNQIETPPGL